MGEYDEKLGKLDARVENCEIEIDGVRRRIHDDVVPQLTIVYYARVTGPMASGALGGLLMYLFLRWVEQ